MNHVHRIGAHDVAVDREFVANRNRAFAVEVDGNLLTGEGFVEGNRRLVRGLLVRVALALVVAIRVGNIDFDRFAEGDLAVVRVNDVLTDGDDVSGRGDAVEAGVVHDEGRSFLLHRGLVGADIDDTAIFGVVDTRFAGEVGGQTGSVRNVVATVVGGVGAEGEAVRRRRVFSGGVIIGGVHREERLGIAVARNIGDGLGSERNGVGKEAVRRGETGERVVRGEINITFCPQGSLCEKVRAGGAGIGGILTPTGVYTPMQDGKQLLEWDNERSEFRFVKPDDPTAGPRYILELPLHADVAFIHAYKADTLGNVVYRRTSRNFNEVFATAADFVIVEAEQIVEVGELDPDQIMTPHFIVDAVVQGKALTEA